MSETPKPPPLPPRLPTGGESIPYATPLYPHNPVSARETLKWLGIGLGIGTLVSAGLWLPIWTYDKKGDMALFLGLGVIGIKFVTGVVMLCFNGWRALGGGLLLSMAVGFLIFFGACAANLN